MTALGALLGGTLAAGILLVITGVTPTPDAPRRPSSHLERRVVLTRLGLGASGAAALGLVTRWPVGALAAAALGWFAPRMAGASRRTRRADTDKIAALATWTEMLRDGFAAGSLLTSTLRATEDVAPVPIRAAVARLCARMRRSRPGSVETALRAFAAELADPTADLVVIALIRASKGAAANLAELLSTLAISARAEVNMRLEIEAKRAEILTQRRMIIGVVTSFCVYLVVLRHSYLAPFSTAAGQAVVAVVVGLFASSLWFMDRFSRLEGAERTIAPEVRK